jgi:hypothetical protein
LSASFGRVGFALELAGGNASWLFETGQITIRYGRKASGFLKGLREITVPDTAIARVTVSAGRNPVLELEPRPGADPILAAAGGQLPDSAQPYRLALRGDQRELAEHYAEEIRGRIALNPDAGKPAERFLLPAPPVPRRINAYDGSGTFDGATVCFRWDWWGASSAKYRTGDQDFPIERIAGVEWSAPGVVSGYLRLVLRDGPPTGLEPDDDPMALTFGLGWGTVADSLPFAAAVLAAVKPAKALPAASGDVVEAIRKLGDLREAGLLTDEEFQRKKTELLDRL